MALVLAIVLAYFFPAWGSYESPLPLDAISSVGIALIFFLYGLKLSPESMKSGLKNWKLHLLIQLSTFLLFPLIILPFKLLTSTPYQHNLWLAFLFLAALPSTVAFSVLMVTLAKGNVAAALLNSSLSGLIGILITPLWVGLFLKQVEGEYQLGHIYLKLLTEILLPVLLGMLLQRFLGAFAKRHSKRLAYFDKLIILLIIYKSFARSIEDGVFVSMALSQMLVILIAVILLYAVIYSITGYLSDRLVFNRADRITAQFCGSKKSLVHGTVFAKILFPAGFPLAMIFLPLMLFHAFQILAGSALAGRIARQSKEEPGLDAPASEVK